MAIFHPCHHCSPFVAQRGLLNIRKVALNCFRLLYKQTETNVDFVYSPRMKNRLLTTRQPILNCGLLHAATSARIIYPKHRILDKVTNKNTTMIVY